MSQKKDLVLIPGLLCDRQVWQSQVDCFDDKFNIIIPEITEVETPAAMIDLVLQQMPAQFALAGHSMGGWLALEVVKRIPDRISDLCLLSTSSERDSLEREQLRTEMMRAVKELGFEAILPALLENTIYQKQAASVMSAMMLRNQHLFFPHNKALILRETCLPSLSTITYKPLLMVGKQDKGFFDSMQLIAQKIPQADLILIENCGHMVTLEQPEQVTKAMQQWLGVG